MCTLQFNFLPTQRSFCNSKPNILPDTKSENVPFFVSPSTAAVTGCASGYRLFNNCAVSEDTTCPTLYAPLTLLGVHVSVPIDPVFRSEYMQFDI
jgi:hypothetical protein